MMIDPQMADTLWIVGLVMLGLLIVFRAVNRKGYTKRSFKRRLGEQSDPDEMQDPEPMLRRTRLQIVMAAIGIATLTFIAFMGIGDDPKGIPLPDLVIDVFR